jgi:hypothetical protein
MRIGDVLRYRKNNDPEPDTVDGLPNYFNVTHTDGCTVAQLESGIDPIKSVVGSDGIGRVPAVLISGSPHKSGSQTTPWQNFFDPDIGCVRYCGDNKAAGMDAAEAPGNRELLKQYRLHSSNSRQERALSCPVIVFKRVAVGARKKGNVCFQGYGIIERAELVTQYESRSGTSFTNCVFQIAILDLQAENEVFDWRWISDRRDNKLTVEETLSKAPKAWRHWVSKGEFEKSRRRVAKLSTTKTAEQQPDRRERKALETIYKFYCRKQNRFESLAAFVAGQILRAGGHAYKEGWITPPSRDHGADFVGRLDLGSGFATAKIVILGQAKCEKLGRATGGNHIARTVARLKRGWIGAYVTTSYFSLPVQQEVLEDKYPILLVNGQRVAQEVLKAVHDKGTDIASFLADIDSKHDQLVQQRDPEQIFYWEPGAPPF